MILLLRLIWTHSFKNKYAFLHIFYDLQGAKIPNLSNSIILIIFLLTTDVKVFALDIVCCTFESSNVYMVP